jgi:hypothetical protein
MHWTASWYGAHCFQKLNWGLQSGQDYAVGNRKVGGNAQSFGGGRWVHHTSFLHDVDYKVMASMLKLPSKQPDWRKLRDHRCHQLPVDASVHAHNNGFPGISSLHFARVICLAVWMMTHLLFTMHCTNVACSRYGMSLFPTFKYFFYFIFPHSTGTPLSFCTGHNDRAVQDRAGRHVKLALALIQDKPSEIANASQIPCILCSCMPVTVLPRPSRSEAR